MLTAYTAPNGTVCYLVLSISILYEIEIIIIQP